MASTQLTLGPPRARTRRSRAWWDGLDPTTRTVVQLCLVLGATVVAYHYSLLTLLQELDVQSPLAYVGLVPLFALALGAAYMRPRRAEPDIHDRQLDYIVGIPLLLVAAAVTMLLPRHMSASFWQWRVDLLAVPLFVAGLIAIVFGVRVLWRQRLSVLYLLLAVPAVYTVVLNSVLSDYTNVTVSALRGLVRLTGLAASQPGAGDAIFNVTHNGTAFPLAVVTACSGVDGLVGFLLTGLVFAAMVRGPLINKSLWLLAGLPLLWVVNLGRILFIFWVGKEWGEDIALDVFHPFIGLVTFSTGVAVWAACHRMAGLRMMTYAPHQGKAANPAAQPSSSSLRGGQRSLAVPAIGAAAVVTIVAALVIGAGDTALRSYNLIEDAVGEPRLASFLVTPASVPGWTTHYVEQFQNGKPEFGPSSLWYRYVYLPGGASGSLKSDVPVTADVINAPGLSGFDAFTIQDCYSFHGWTERATVDEDLGGGITGQALSYDSSEYGDWSVLYWVWPVKGTIGNTSETRYERVVLYVQDGAGAVLTDPLTGQVTSSAMSLDQRLVVNRDFLTAFARKIVKAQRAATTSSSTEALG